MTPMTPMTLPYDIDDPALARATWSRLAEPDSASAAMVVGRLGPSPALRWLLEEAIDPSGQVRGSPRPPVPQPPPGMSGSADISACWAQVAARWAPRLEGLDIRRELDVLDRLGGSLILPGEPWWPPGLDELEHPPFCLWVRGDPSLLVNLYVSSGCRWDRPAACAWRWWGPGPLPGTGKRSPPPWPQG